jgi:predicted amidohydrolase YtcJ
LAGDTTFAAMLTAIRLYTSDAARVIGEADRLGTLERGRLADVVAYRGDPFSVPIEDLQSLRPAFTMLAGRIVPTTDQNH